MKSMQKLFTVFIVILLAASIIASCSDQSTGYDNESTKKSEEESVNPNDTYEGTLKITTSDDGRTATISYMLNGKELSYTVPNNANYVSGGFAGTDDLGRTLPSSTLTGEVRIQLLKERRGFGQ